MGRLAILPCLGFILAGFGSAAVRYTVEDIGPVLNVRGINNRGEVLAEDVHHSPFLYRNGRAEKLPQSPAGPFVASAFNDSGVVAGYVNPAGTYEYRLATFTCCKGELRVFKDVTGVLPVAINNRGHISGNLVKSYQTFVYSDGHLRTYSPTGVLSATRRMNKNDDVVGVTQLTGPGNAPPHRIAFLYHKGRLSTLTVPGALESEADAINERGDIAGVFNESSTAYSPQPFIYRKGRFQKLGHVFGQSVEQDLVTGLNRSGVIVGTGRVTGKSDTAYVYFPKSGFADLNQLIPPGSGWQLQFASGINDRGQVAGMGMIGGKQHGFILTPVKGSEND